MSRCPACQTDAPPHQVAQRPAPEPFPWHWVRGGACLLVIALPAILWAFSEGTLQAIIVALLATFISVALCLRSVSTANVAKGTMGAIVAKNVSTGAAKRLLGDDNQG